MLSYQTWERRCVDAFAQPAQIPLGIQPDDHQLVFVRKVQRQIGNLPPRHDHVHPLVDNRFDLLK